MRDVSTDLIDSKRFPCVQVPLMEFKTERFSINEAFHRYTGYRGCRRDRANGSPPFRMTLLEP